MEPQMNANIRKCLVRDEFAFICVNWRLHSSVVAQESSWNFIG